MKWRWPGRLEPILPGGLYRSGYEDGEYLLWRRPYIEGERLDKRLKRFERLSEPEVILIALHLLSAEQHLYDAGYLYRDLKRENIIIRSGGIVRSP